MAIDKLGIYNDALRLVGESPLVTLTDDVEARYDLDSIWNLDGVDYCLELVKPKFATSTASSTGAATVGGLSLAYTHPLPADYVTLFEVYADSELDQPVERYILEGGNLYTDFETVYWRYINNAQVEADFTPSFARVVSGYLAREIAHKFDPDRYDALAAEFTAKVEAAQEMEGLKEPEARPYSPDPLTDDFRQIYNDALQILGLEPIVSNTDDSMRRVMLDYALEAELVEAVLEDMSWQFGSQTSQVFYDTGVDPAWGYSYACQKPATLHRLDGVFVDEYLQIPLTLYHDEDGYIYSNHQVIYLSYVDTAYLTDPTLWPAYFKRLVSARMALDAGPTIPGANADNAMFQYDTRRSEAQSTDVMQSPPQKIASGSWTNSRFGRFNRGNYRGRP